MRFSVSTPQEFLSTPSARRATPHLRPKILPFRISIHALREEGDGQRCPQAAAPGYFYPRPPRGGRRGAPHGSKYILNISIHAPRPPRGGRRRGGDFDRLGVVISIHALREEGDAHAAPAEHAENQFLSTPSARRATSRGPASKGGRQHFHPRPPRGGRRGRLPPAGLRCNFYPHPPRGGRRHGQCLSNPAGAISIHALREEGDDRLEDGTEEETYFYPRPPRGGRPQNAQQGEPSVEISIHALREEGDAAHTAAGTASHNFYPRPPRGGRPGYCR